MIRPKRHPLPSLQGSVLVFSGTRKNEKSKRGILYEDYKGVIHMKINADVMLCKIVALAWISQLLSCAFSC